MVNKFKIMSETDLFEGRLFYPQKKGSGDTRLEQMATEQPLGTTGNEECSGEDHANQDSRTAGNWCEVVSSLSNVNAKQAWKNGTEKLSQTFHNFRATFGVLSQKMKKSTKKRQPLINVESPVTPYTRSRAALGRTPTKLYSPFSIDTPTGKENVSNRFIQGDPHSVKLRIKGEKKKPRRIRLNLGVEDSNSNIGEAVLSNDALQTQIGIYEFQSVANRIVQSGSKN